MEMRRESHDSVQIHWLKFEALMNRLDLAKHALSADLVFMRALKSLMLQPTQRTTLLMSLDAQGMDHTYPNLKKCTVRLFGLYKETSPNGKEDERKNAQSFLSGADVLNIEENDDEHIFMVRKKKNNQKQAGDGTTGHQKERFRNEHRKRHLLWEGNTVLSLWKA